MALSGVLRTECRPYRHPGYRENDLAGGGGRATIGRRTAVDFRLTEHEQRIQAGLQDNPYTGSKLHP